jgi:hypothetical protein
VPHPYLLLDAKVEKVRDGGRVVNRALVIAHGVHETGRREILGLRCEAETEACWTGFLRGLVARGLTGVQLAISDAHAALRAAIAKVLGCAWPRFTVHFLRDSLGHARKDSLVGDEVAAQADWPCGPARRSRRTVERPTRISAASAGTKGSVRPGPAPRHGTCRSRPPAVGPAIRSQRASDKMRLVW